MTQISIKINYACPFKPSICYLKAIQNLKDAGCCRETVERFLALGDAGDVQGQLQLLAQHRKCLLEKVHREERRIQCLDYLVYQMEKESPKE